MNKKFALLATMLVAMVLVSTPVLAQEETEPQIFSMKSDASAGIHTWTLTIAESGFYVIEESYQAEDQELVTWVRVQYTYLHDEAGGTGDFLGIVKESDVEYFVFQHYTMYGDETGPVFQPVETQFFDSLCWVHDGEMQEITESGCAGVVVTYNRPAGQ